MEFRFAPGQEWDLTIPGKLHQHELIRNEYSGKPRQQNAIEASLRIGEEQPFSVQMREGIGRLQLVSEDAKRLLSLGPDVLSVNVLRPYDNWEQFRPRVEAALNAYRDVARPKAVERIGVRYINKIVLPSTEIELATYFRLGPLTVEDLPKRMVNFMNRSEYVYDDGLKLIITLASIASPEGSTAFLLDLDVILEGGEPLSLDEVMDTVDDLHDREGIAFEATITEKTREVFDAT